MMDRAAYVLVAVVVLLHGCASSPDKSTLAQLRNVEPDAAEVPVGDSLAKAMEAYQRFLVETPTNAQTPEAMRRLADLQIEKEYGIVGTDRLIAAQSRGSLPRPQPSDTGGYEPATAFVPAAALGGSIADHSESEDEFEQRATGAEPLPSAPVTDVGLPGSEEAGAGARQAIATYQRILREYPHYERNDQVLYQMARAYDELGEPDEAMAIMQRLIGEFQGSAYADEVYFRRAEYFFVRRKFLDAEESYAAVVAMGPGSDFYELALYKLGWSLYKQELYDAALHQYMALLDHKLTLGYDFDRVANVTSLENEDAQTDTDRDGDRRVADTFRVISLAFSNLGGPEVLNEYYASYGRRSYEDRIYSNLGEFYLTKLRYQDAATVYESFVDLNPFHKVAPTFSMRVVEIYEKGEFGQLVVEAKQDFARRYGLKAEYWQHFDVASRSDVLGHLKTNLMDLATHYHSLYQDENLVESRPEHFGQALLWYREFLGSFPQDPTAPKINYQLADLLFEQEDFRGAAEAYEHTAYGYAAHEQAAAAGYAAIYAHRKHLEVVAEVDAPAAKLATVDSSLRFSDTFPTHEHAATVLAAAAEDLYAMKSFERAVAAGTKLIEQHSGADIKLRQAAWSVVAHSSFELARFAIAEQGYSRVLELMPATDPTRAALLDNLAASIYKQGEAAGELEDYRTAADHYLRIGSVAPGSNIRPAAEYDAATALMKLEDWAAAAKVFNAFRAQHADHPLQADVTKQLAFVYRQSGNLAQSAQEYERVAADAENPELRRDAMLLAGELYSDAKDPRALDVYLRYAEAFPHPVDLALETRFKIASFYKAAHDLGNYHDQLRRIVAIDGAAGTERTARTKFLAGQSALVLAQLLYEHFEQLSLTQPFDKSLAEKNKRMATALSAFEALVDYEVAEVTAAATFYMAEIYGRFGQALLASERPGGLTAAARTEYELALEEEAFPFEERTIDVHEKNIELMRAGTFNAWVQRSLDRLATLMPGRYAKAEISSGFLGPVEVFAYRPPAADVVDMESGSEVTSRSDAGPGAASDASPSPKDSGGSSVSAAF